MHSHTIKRRQESLTNCINQWKLYAALEIQFNKANRNLIIKKIFHAWKYYTKDIVYDKWAMIVTNDLHKMQFIRKIFKAWKQKVIFLDWNNLLLLNWEKIADKHYLRSLFLRWIQNSSSSRSILQQVSSFVPRIVIWMHFHSWYHLCNIQWRRRGQLLRRFFRYMKTMMIKRDENSSMYNCSMSHLIHYKLRWLIKLWCQFVQSRRMYVTENLINRDQVIPSIKNSKSRITTSTATASARILTASSSHPTSHPSKMGNIITPNTTLLSTYPFTPTRLSSSSPFIPIAASSSIAPSSSSSSSIHIIRSNANKSFINTTSNATTTTTCKIGINRWKLNRSMQVMSHRKRRWAHSCFIMWNYHSSVSRRQKLCHEAAIHKYTSLRVLKYISCWYSNVRYIIQQKKKHRRWLLKTIWRGWNQYVLIEKKEKRQTIGIANLTKKVVSRWLLLILRRWCIVIKKEKCYRHIHSFIIWKSAKRCKILAFNLWRSKWSSLLYWRIKDLHIEYDRVKQLNDLHEESILALEQKNDEINKENNDLEVSL